MNNELDGAATLINAGSSRPVPLATTDLAPQVREMTRDGWVPASGVSTPVGSVPTADAPGAPGATQRAAFVQPRPEPATVAVPALGQSPGEKAARR